MGGQGDKGTTPSINFQPRITPTKTDAYKLEAIYGNQN